LCPNILVTDPNFAALGFHEPVEAAQERRLPRSTFADDGCRPAGRHIEAHIVQSEDAAEIMTDVSRRE
jgi:hypothetical protein